MMTRIAQFIYAVFAKVSESDRRFVERELNGRLQVFFFGMSIPDQCHAIRTARAAISLATERADKVDMPLLKRCALLHDIGRRKGDLGIFWKSAAVLFASWFPAIARIYASGAKGNGILYRKMRIYFHHAEIGAEMLVRSGFMEEAAIIAGHHEAPADGDPPELRLLRMADNMS